MPTVGLCMIVRDEARVVRRCLDSARGLIDAALVVDTGSRDGTREVVRAWLAENAVLGTILEEPWRDFAHNRTAALAALRSVAGIDYALVLDADDRLAFAPGFDPAAFKAGLWADVYDLDIRHGETVYRRPLLFANRPGFAYRAVLHEYLVVPPEARRAAAEGVGVLYGGDGARSRDPGKYARDAVLLEGALEAEADPALRARYAFYLAQSLRDAGRLGAATDAYLRRAELGHWAEEVFESLLNAGCLMAAAGAPTGDVLAVLERATGAAPARAEALHAAARICRERGEHALGLAAAERGLGVERPEAGLFLRPWVYETGLLDEYAVNASWAGRDVDCLAACAILLARTDLDPDMRARVRANRDHAHGRLCARGSLWPGTLGDRAPRVAVVTAYGAEPPEALERCLASVARQSVPADHVLVAAGAPRDGLDDRVARHVRLDARPGGMDARALSAARAVGGLLAAADYTAICFLDATGWYDDDHVERCLTAALTVGLDRCAYVAASRRFHRPDFTVMPIADEDPDAFVDASCLFLLPPAYGLLAGWAMGPAALAPVGDRAFFLQVKAFLEEARSSWAGGLVAARTRRPSMNCVAAYAALYEALGEASPAGALPLPDHAGHRAWIAALPPEAVVVIRGQIGVDIRHLYRAR